MQRFNKYKKYLSKILIVITVIAFIVAYLSFQQASKSNNQILSLTKTLDASKKELNELKNQDQLKINEQLKKDIKATNDVFGKTLKAYERLTDLKAQKQDTIDLDKSYAQIVRYLADINYSSGSALLTSLNGEIDKKYATIATAQQAAAAATAAKAQAASVSNSPPSSGYSFQAVKTDSGTFNVAIIAADLNSTRVIIDTASDSDCANNCPVMALGDYVSRSGAFAGINGPFFCPAEYPSCAGKTNSFDTLLMNKNKHYFNSDNNKYSTVPLMYFSGNSAGVRGQSLEWGRDTGVDSVVANYPLYISGGNNNFGGSSDPKINSAGPRTFVANKGNMAFIGIVYSASAAQAALVLKALGMDNALGLDQGGSTALWSGGYKAGPGRGLPSAILFVRK